MKYLFPLAFIAFTLAGNAQKISNKLSFQKGQKLQVVTEIKSVVTQEMMGQSMDFNVNATTNRLFNVNDISGGNATVEHKVKRLQFNFDGMGKTESFDSDKEEDMKSDQGKVAEKALKNVYTMTLDPTGKIIAVKTNNGNPDTANAKDSSDPMASMMGQIFSGLDVPKVGSTTEFKVLPDKEVSKGESWTDTASSNKDEKRKATYTINDVTNNEVIVGYTEESTTKMTQENMGMEVTINKNDKTTGKITLDKKTGLLKQSTATTQSTGTAEVMGQSMPLNSKITKTVTVTSI